MATRVVMAQLSPTMEEGRLIEWKVKEGDAVSQGDIVAEIETDKANMDVEAMGSGVLRKILVREGQTAPVGALIGIIADPDEDISELLAEAGGGPEDAGAEGGEGPVVEGGEEPALGGGEEPALGGAEGPAVGSGEKPAVAAAAGEASAAEPASAGDGRVPGDGRIKASPVARKLAREKGVDLAALRGSGPAGRIVKADVEAALAGGPAAPSAPGRPEAAGAEPSPAAPLEAAPARPAAEAPPTVPALEARLEERVEEASQMRKAIARRLVQSLGPVPHFFLTTEVDMERLLELREELNERWKDGKIGVTDLLLKATAEALVRHPNVNASWQDGAVRYHGTVDLGIAVAVESGLITPVLRAADRKNLRQISRESRSLIERARARKLLPEEYQGATFSVSNLGMYEIDEFTAIINPPEAGILAVGRTAERPVVVNGEIVVRRRMRVTMSCDHRVIDGAMGAEFLGTFKAMLENPLVMLL